MADIVAVFGWPPAGVVETVPEIVRWRSMAIDRWRKMNGIKED
ncbi:GpE family phage tail protein [Caulobacter segnis]|uniref:GpE family phage tail protein n=1 Tax=Caulobacter segnis TaxID=88688 RepID=A0A2W5WSQ3_9CAUL|nr:GpE family phage tail protein [Caulobacter segnis]PZR37188.1 MAG: GpE family phage tail protein [Caulobacter segnis]